MIVNHVHVLCRVGILCQLSVSSGTNIVTFYWARCCLYSAILYSILNSDYMRVILHTNTLNSNDQMLMYGHCCIYRMWCITLLSEVNTGNLIMIPRRHYPCTWSSFQLAYLTDCITQIGFILYTTDQIAFVRPPEHI